MPPKPSPTPTFVAKPITTAPVLAKSAPAEPEFINLNTSPSMVYGEDRKMITVLPYSRRSSQPNGVYVVKGIWFKQFCGVKGPLYRKDGGGTKSAPVAPALARQSGTLPPEVDEEVVKAVQAIADDCTPEQRADMIAYVMSQRIDSPIPLPKPLQQYKERLDKIANPVPPGI